MLTWSALKVSPVFCINEVTVICLSGCWVRHAKQQSGHKAGVGQKDIMIVVRPVIMVWRWLCYIKSREEVKMLVFSLGATRTGLQMSSLCERAG